MPNCRFAERHLEQMHGERKSARPPIGGMHFAEHAPIAHHAGNDEEQRCQGRWQQPTDRRVLSFTDILGIVMREDFSRTG